MPDVIERARAYVERMESAVSGQGGHDATFAVACVLVHGFALSENEARPILEEYNLRCVPPWDERQLEHKLQSAMTQGGHKHPRGYLAGSNRARQAEVVHEKKKVTPVKPAQKYDDLSRTAELPKPITDGCCKLIEAAFEPGEGIGIAQEELNDEGRGIPGNAGPTLSREEWLKMLKVKGGDPNRIFSSAAKTGAFIRINPLKIGGSKDADVTAFRHALLEFDKLDAVKQWNLIEQSGVPCTAVLHSGNKSLHAWVRVDARDRTEYAQRVKTLFEHFEQWGLDDKNKNPSRFSRLPGMVRGNNWQALLSLKCGAATWNDWVGLDAEGLPPIVELPTFLARELTPPTEIVTGMLHAGSKMVLGGSSKSHKTFALVDLALSVSSGSKWWGLDTKPGRVLYINFEIQPFFFQFRLRTIAGKRGIDASAAALDLWNLRGHSASLDALIPDLLDGIRVKKSEYSMIIIDPIYKGLGARDENKAGDIADLLNEVERLALSTGAAVVFGGHFSKGNQAQKGAMDRIGGSGVFARDPDSIVTLTQHRERDCFAVESTLRNFRPQEPFVVKWEYPLFTRITLDPTELAEVGKKGGSSEAKRKFKPEDVMPHVPVTGQIEKGKLVRLLQDAGCGENRAKQLIKEAMSEVGGLHEWKVKRKGTRPEILVSRIPQPEAELR